MKKALAYAATAIILGFAIMMLPRTLENQPPTSSEQTQNLSDKGGEGFKTVPGLVSQPANLLPSSLIVLSGVVAGLSLYVMLKKRTIFRL